MPAGTRSRVADPLPDLVETHLPDDPSLARFHTMPLDDKVLVIRLGLSMIKGGNACLREKERVDVDAALEAQHEEHLTKLDDVRRAAAVEAEARLEVLKTANSELQDQVASLVSRMHEASAEIEEKHHKRALETRDHYEGRLDMLQVSLDKTRKEHEDYLAASAVRAANSCVKGQDGEQHVFARLNLLFPKAEIEDTHAIPGRGDFIMREGSFVMMIESKNYTRNVQKGEIDKFYRDVESPANADVQCAVFVSLTSGISNREDFAFEVISGKPVIFVHRLGERYDQLVSVVKFFHLVLNHDAVDLTKKEVVDQLNHVGSALQRNVKRQKQKADKSYQEQINLICEQENAILSLLTTIGGGRV